MSPRKACNRDSYPSDRRRYPLFAPLSSGFSVWCGPTFATLLVAPACESERVHFSRHMVDRLLASRLYGERMATDWLDAAGYADTNRFHNDFARTMWPWRDWTISAFNRNKRALDVI